MRVLLRALPLAALGVSLCACATVVRGTTTDFQVVSTPPGASVSTSTGFSCSPTPCSMKLQRKAAFDATISMPGYKAQTVHIDSRVSGGGAAGFAGNAVAGGLIGMAIDGTDGAMDDLVPNPLKVTLEQTASAAPAAQPAAQPAQQPAAQPTAQAEPAKAQPVAANP